MTIGNNSSIKNFYRINLIESLFFNGQEKRFYLFLHTSIHIKQ